MICCWIPGRQHHFQANPEYSTMANWWCLGMFGHLPRKRLRFSPWFSSIAEVVSSCIQLSGCWPGCRRSCLLATQRCRARRPPKQVVSRRLDRWYRPIGLRAQVPSPTWNQWHWISLDHVMSISRLHRVGIVFRYLGNLAVENSNLTGFPENWACVCEFPENPLYQKPLTTSIVLQKGGTHVIAKRCASVSLTFGIIWL